MDIAGGFEPTDSEGFIKVQSIRIKAYENMLKVGPIRGLGVEGRGMTSIVVDATAQSGKPRRRRGRGRCRGRHQVKAWTFSPSYYLLLSLPASARANNIRPTFPM